MSKTGTIAVTVPLEINLGMVANLLCCAFEGGSNYFYCLDTDRYVKPTNIPKLGPIWDDEVYCHIHYPLSEDGSVCVLDKLDPNDLDVENDNPENLKAYTLNLEVVKKGLEIMATKYPKHFADFIAENEDAGTGDIALQCMLFGEAKYG